MTKTMIRRPRRISTRRHGEVAVSMAAVCKMDAKISTICTEVETPTSRRVEDSKRKGSRMYRGQ